MATPKLVLELRYKIMNGFCLAFAETLLARLKDLKEEDRIFKDGEAEVRRAPHISSKLTPVARAVAGHLYQQVFLAEPHPDANAEPAEIDDLLAAAEEFIATLKAQ